MSFGFDESYYLSKNPDVTAAVARGQFLSGYDHFVKLGAAELRNPNAFFNAQEYAAANPDVLSAVSQRVFPSLWDHYINFGLAEGRAPSTALAGFNAAAYLAANPDVAAAVTAGTFKSAMEHYLSFGVQEGRSAVDAGGQPLTGGASGGQTFTLTDKIDTVTGTSGNDTFIGEFAATNTINVGDQINGGAGTDTLKVFGTLGTLPINVRNIEVMDFVNPGNTSIDVSTIAGVQTLQVDQVNATGGKTFTVGAGVTTQVATAAGAAAGGTLTIANAATDPVSKVVLAGYQGGSGVTPDALTITGAASTTTQITSQSAKNVVSTLTLAATTETVNIAAASELSVTTGLVGGSVKQVLVTGAGKVTIAGASTDLAATVTVDGTANTGGLNFTDEAAGSTLTFKGGSGADSVTFAAGRLTTADILTGGAGSDTIVINDTAPVYAAINAATDFEVLQLNTTGATVDVAQLTKINSFKVGAGNLTETFNNSLSTSTYVIDTSSDNTGTVTVSNKVGESVANVTLDAGAATTVHTLTNLTLSGASTVNLVSTGTGTGAANTITTLANADNSNIVVTGSKDLVITNALAATTTGSKVDASAFTGKLTVTGSGQADVLIGGSGADTINGGAGKDTINAGAGNDTITINTAGQADQITTGAGADIVKFSGASLAAALATSAGTTDVVRITDFVAGTDKIGLVDTSGAFTSVVLANTQTIASAADLTAVFSGINAIAASTAAGAASAVVVNVTAGAAAGTYLYVNDATAGVSNTTDMLVNITGITGTLTASDFVFA